MSDANPQASPEPLADEWAAVPDDPICEVVSVTHDQLDDDRVALFDETEPDSEAVIEVNADWHFDLEVVR